MEVMLHRWQTEIDEADRVGAAHSRHILEASADLVTLPPGAGEQTVRISFEGQSFVLHQVCPGIRIQVPRLGLPLKACADVVALPTGL